MSVYVDRLFTAVPAGTTDLARQARRHGTRWCHMFADTRQELDDMADRIGLQRTWVQERGEQALVHYDLVPSKRAAAVRAGAQEITTAGYIRMARKNAKDIQAENEASRPPQGDQP